MKMTEFNCNDYQIISLEGDFDADAVRLHEAHFERLPDYEVKGIVFDMSKVSFLDSSGIGAMVFLFKRLIASQRDMNIIGLNGQPQRIMKLLRIDKTISTYTDLSSFAPRAEAVSHL